MSPHQLELAGPERQRKNVVRVTPASLDQTYPNSDIVDMKPRARQQLQFGWFTYVYVDMPDQQSVQLSDAKFDKFTIASLCAMSPVIKAAVGDPADHKSIDHILLPKGSVEAYKAILAWLDVATIEGYIRHIPQIYEKPLANYWNILDIADKLRIDAITSQLKPRFDNMITWVQGKNWNLQIADIRHVYEMPCISKDHPLRKELVKNLARAWLADDLKGKKGKAVEELTWEIKEFWTELERAMQMDVGEKQ